MDYETYEHNYFADPEPIPRFRFGGISGVALFFPEFEAAASFYSEVLGPPNYVEGAGTRSWRLGPTWLTILKGTGGTPENVEVILEMETPAEAERLHAAFVCAGARGGEISDQLMHAPVRYCPLTDPFGTQLLIISELER